MNTSEIEKEISDQIIIWVKDNSKATKVEIENKITQEITKKNYLKEDWQAHYAMERIESYLNQSLENNKKLKKGKSEIFNFIINLAIALFFYSFLFHGVLNIQLGGLASLIILGAIYLVVTEMKELTSTLLIAFFIFILLATNIPKAFNSDSLWFMLILMIISYIIAKQIKRVLKNYLTKKYE